MIVIHNYVACLLICAPCILIVNLLASTHCLQKRWANNTFALFSPPPSFSHDCQNVSTCLGTLTL